MRSRFVLGIISLLAYDQLWSQQVKMGELKISALEKLPEEEYIVARQDTSVLIIFSEIPNLGFASNLEPKLEIRQNADTEWELYVKPGDQRLTIRANGYVAEETDVINLEAKCAYRLKVFVTKPIPGMFSIKTKPEGARLRINGAQINDLTPFRNDEAPPGRYFVQVSKDGYTTVDTTVFVVAQKDTLCELELTPIEPIKKPFYRKWWFLTGGSAVIAGSAAYIFRPKDPDQPTTPLAGHPEFP